MLSELEPSLSLGRAEGFFGFSQAILRLGRISFCEYYAQHTRSNTAHTNWRHDWGKIIADPSSMSPPRAPDVPHLLEWYASYCMTVSDSCTDTRTKRLLWLLARDLALECQKVRDADRKQTTRASNP